MVARIVEKTAALRRGSVRGKVIGIGYGDGFREEGDMGRHQGVSDSLRDSGQFWVFGRGG